jgi:hypothetical protein
VIVTEKIVTASPRRSGFLELKNNPCVIPAVAKIHSFLAVWYITAFLWKMLEFLRASMIECLP